MIDRLQPFGSTEADKELHAKVLLIMENLKGLNVKTANEVLLLVKEEISKTVIL